MCLSSQNKQQRYHFIDILLIIIGVGFLVPFITATDNFSVNTLKLIIRNDDRELFFSGMVVSHILSDYELKISEMIAYHLDENNYCFTHILIKIPKIQMCFLIAYHFVIVLMILAFECICLMILIACGMLFLILTAFVCDVIFRQKSTLKIMRKLLTKI